MVSRSNPLAGVLVSSSGAGDVIPRSVFVDLDKSGLVGVPSVGANGDWKFPIQVSGSEAEKLQVFAVTKACDCQFNLVVDYLDGDDHKSSVITNHGRPFRVTSKSAAVGEAYWTISGDQVTLAPAR